MFVLNALAKGLFARGTYTGAVANNRRSTRFSNDDLQKVERIARARRAERTHTTLTGHRHSIFAAFAAKQREAH